MISVSRTTFRPRENKTHKKKERMAWSPKTQRSDHTTTTRNLATHSEHTGSDRGPHLQGRLLEQPDESGPVNQAFASPLGWCVAVPTFAR